MKLILAFAICAVVLLGLDFVWLGLAVEPLYRPAMGSLLRTDFNLVPAVGFYVIYAFALAYLVIRPALISKAGFGVMTLKAAAMGLAAFATYDLTALAVVRDWPLTLSLIDMAWGTLAAVIACNVTALVLKLIRQD